MEIMTKRGKRLLIEMASVIMIILVIDTVIISCLIGQIEWRLIVNIIFTGTLFYFTIKKRNWARVLLGISSALVPFNLFLVSVVSFYTVTKVIALVLALFYGLVAYNLFFSDDISTYMSSEE